MNATLTKYSPWMLGLFRIVTALVFMEHGTQKLFHFPPQEQRFGGGAGGRAASRALAQGADAASSAISNAVDAASSAVSSAVDAVSSMASSIQPPTGGPGRDGMPASMQALFLVAGILETFGGLALVLGLLTRPIAFIV